MLSNGECGIISSIEIEHFEEAQTTYNFEVADFHTYYVGEQGILVHNACILDELGVKNFNEIGSKYTPDQLIDKLDDLGFSKTIEAARSTTSGPATFMNRGGLEFRIMSSPANGNAYFRVMNSFGNYLGASGQVIDNLAGKAFRLATHFYF